MARNFDIEFDTRDCELFEAYQERKRWPSDVPDADREHFGSIRKRLQGVADHAVESFPGETELKAYASRTNPNAFSPPDLWMCIYPSDAPHQSFSLQVGALIRSDGGEVFFALGAGQAQIAPDRLQEANAYLTHVKESLARVPDGLSSEIESRLGNEWAFRRSWRAAPGAGEFDSLADWIAFAASAESSGASVSRYLSPKELQDLGPNFSQLIEELATTVAPIIDWVSSNSDSDQVGEEGEPPLTDFEKELNAVAGPIYEGDKTGYAWEPVDKLLTSTLKLSKTRCKKASGSGRAANVLVEGNDKFYELYLIFIGPNYSREAFLRVAADRIKRFPNVVTVAVADEGGGPWRVRSIVEREGVGLAAKLQSSFPAVKDSDIHLVETNFNSDSDSEDSLSPSVHVEDPEEFKSAMAGKAVELMGLEALSETFRGFAEKSGVIIEETTAVDFLAATLSSQLLLFAGPSGTGKSVSARLLASFFARDDHSKVFEARRQWISSDDFVGYYSVLADRFATTPETEKLIDLHEVSTGPLQVGTEAGEPPIVVIEEINLSPPEGYLAPVIHGLSGIGTPDLSWELHSRVSGAVDQGSIISVPERIQLGPYPRFLGTINVDSTAHAPARKVASRSCVMLLEPQPLTADELRLLSESRVGEGSPEGSPGSAFLGDPLSALRALDDPVEDQLQGALLEIKDHLGGVLISRRDALRALAYMAYYVRLCSSSTPEQDVVRLAAENAILHFVLPTVDADHFTIVLEALNAADLTPGPSTQDDLGGLLRPRVERLIEMASGSGLGFADALDFWTALS